MKLNEEKLFWPIPSFSFFETLVGKRNCEQHSEREEHQQTFQPFADVNEKKAAAHETPPRSSKGNVPNKVFCKGKASLMGGTTRKIFLGPIQNNPSDHVTPRAINAEPRYTCVPIIDSLCDSRGTQTHPITFYFENPPTTPPPGCT